MIHQLVTSLFKKKVQPALPSPKVWKLWEHQRGWGWNVQWLNFETRRIGGHYHNRYNWKVGDEVQAKMQSGKIARFEIVEFESVLDVWDMFFITVKDIGYLDET